MLAHCKIVDVSVCASQAAARKAQPLWQQLGFQAKINERKKNVFVLAKRDHHMIPQLTTQFSAMSFTCSTKWPVQLEFQTMGFTTIPGYW